MMSDSFQPFTLISGSEAEKEEHRRALEAVREGSKERQKLFRKRVEKTDTNLVEKS